VRKPSQVASGLVRVPLECKRYPTGVPFDYTFRFMRSEPACRNDRSFFKYITKTLCIYQHKN
jgi:hypothetical protein